MIRLNNCTTHFFELLLRQGGPAQDGEHFELAPDARVAKRLPRVRGGLLPDVFLELGVLQLRLELERDSRNSNRLCTKLLSVTLISSVRDFDRYLVLAK